MRQTETGRTHKRLDEFRRDADAMIAKINEPRLRAIYEHARERVETGNTEFWLAACNLKRVPVTIDEFIESEDFMGNQIEVWSTLRQNLREMNPDVFLGEPPVTEALMGGATGTGKTIRANLTVAYQLYLLTCFRSPHHALGLASGTIITFAMQSLSGATTMRAIYRPFRRRFLEMPYTQRHLEWDRKKDSSLLFDGNIEVVPTLASTGVVEGQAVIGGILDEVNLMQVVEDSKLIPGPHGPGGKYDQAEVAYRTMRQRRQSRFMTKGVSIGVICVLGSTQYRDDFLDRRIDEVVHHHEPGIVVCRQKQYEVNETLMRSFSGDTFRLLVGTDRYPTRILDDDAVAGADFPEDGQIERVPVEMRQEFLIDPDKMLRDICGIVTAAINPL